MDFVKISEEEINVGELYSRVLSSCCGAVSLFVGTTRDNFEGKEVTRLVYEAYESMAITALKDVCTEVRLKWPAIVNIAIEHRLGEVGPCEASVAIAISSPHRPDSLAAVSFTIDRLKATVPIWKKEEYADSKGEWKQNKECQWSLPHRSQDKS